MKCPKILDEVNLTVTIGNYFISLCMISGQKSGNFLLNQNILSGVGLLPRYSKTFVTN